MRFILALVGLGMLLCVAGCGSSEEQAAPETVGAAAVPAADPGAPGTSAVMTDARTSLKAGNVDAAAARLAQLQLQQAAFNAQQAKDYRQLLSEAYDQAIEAAQRGDPRGEAAIKLLRAAAPR